MTLVVLVILAACWAVVLVPPLLRSRTEWSADSVGDFNHRLGVLGRTNGTLHGPALPRRRPAAAKRRRDVLRGLTGSVAVTGLLAVSTGAPLAWALHIVADLLLVSYLALWAWVRSAQVERMEKVRALPAHRRPQLALRRAASS